jgi:hypothetical protein
MTKRRSAAVGSILVFPSALFIAASILKFSFGLPWLYEGLGSFADPKSSLADAVVTTVVLLGPVAAAAVALWPVVRLRLARGDGSLEAAVSLRLAWWNLAVGVVSLGLMALLFGHLVADAMACSAGATRTC